MKHILEYEEHEIRGLLGDLEKIGQAKKVQAKVEINFSGYRRVSGSVSTLDYNLIVTPPFWSTGTEEGDFRKTLSLIQSGEFETQFPKWMNPESIDAVKKGSPKITEKLEKESLVERSRKFTTLKEFLEDLQMEVKELNIKYSRNKRNLVFLWAVVAPEGSSKIDFLHTFKSPKAGVNFEYYE